MKQFENICKTDKKWFTYGDIEIVCVCAFLCVLPPLLTNVAAVWEESDPIRRGIISCFMQVCPTVQHDVRQMLKTWKGYC